MTRRTQFIWPCHSDQGKVCAEHTKWFAAILPLPLRMSYDWLWNLPRILVLLFVWAGRGVCRSLLVRQDLGSAFAAIQRRLCQLPRLGHVLDYAARYAPATRRQIWQMWFTGRSLLPCSASQGLVVFAEAELLYCVIRGREKYTGWVKPHISGSLYNIIKDQEQMMKET